MFIRPINPVTISNLQNSKRNNLKNINNTSFGMARMSYKRLFAEYSEFYSIVSASETCRELLRYMSSEGKVLRKDLYDLFMSGAFRTPMRRLTENDDPQLRDINDEAEGYGIEFIRGPENSSATYFNSGRQNAGFFDRLTGNYDPSPQIVITGPGNYNHLQFNFSYNTKTKCFQITRFDSKTGKISYNYSNS